MSTSIYGKIEIKKYDTGFDDWYSIIDVGIALTENYDLFGCLFGVRNPANFNPLFESRGQPEDCSQDLLSDIPHPLRQFLCFYNKLIISDFYPIFRVLFILSWHINRHSADRGE